MTHQSKVSKKRAVYDLVDKNDSLVRLGTKKYAKRLGLWRRAVHIFVLNKKGHLLISKRGPHLFTYPDLFTSSAGGHVERGESYKNAAQRELFEELGIKSQVKDLGRFDVEDSHGKIIHHLFTAPASRVFPDSREVASCMFFPLPKVLKMIRSDPKKYTLPFRRAIRYYLQLEKQRSTLR